MAKRDWAWPNINRAAYGWFFMEGDLTIATTMEIAARILGHIPLVGGWIASHLQGYAESEWLAYAREVKDADEPIVAMLKTWTASMVKKTIGPVKTALWKLEAAVWRIQHQYIPQVIRYIFQTINHAAASGYQAEKAARKSAVERAAAAVVSDLPIVRQLLSRIVGLALDLIEADDPLLRIALGFALRELIKHLGVEHAAGAALSDLIGPLIGDAPPTNLHDVIRRMCQDTQAAADWIAQDGQPMVTDLAADNRLGQIMTDVLGGTLGLGGLALMVHDPQRAASVTADALRVGLPGLAAASLALGQPVQAAEFGFMAAMADDPFAWAHDLSRLAG